MPYKMEHLALPCHDALQHPLSIGTHYDGELLNCPTVQCTSKQCTLTKCTHFI